MTDTTPEQNQAEGPAFSVHNVYIKDISYEAPNTPHIFSEEWKPKLDFDLQMGRQVLAEDVHEVVLDVTITVKIGEEEKVAFIVEIQQAGVFSAEGFDENQLQQVLSVTAPGILFPYVREAVSNCVTKGGFPQLVLPPMNFEAMYQQQMQEAQNEVATAS